MRKIFNLCGIGSPKRRRRLFSGEPSCLSCRVSQRASRCRSLFGSDPVRYPSSWLSALSPSAVATILVVAAKPSFPPFRFHAARFSPLPSRAYPPGGLNARLPPAAFNVLDIAGVTVGVDCSAANKDAKRDEWSQIPPAAQSDAIASRKAGKPGRQPDWSSLELLTRLLVQPRLRSKSGSPVRGSGR